MHLIEKEVEEILIANLVLKFHINDLQNLKRNKNAYVLRIKIMKEIRKLKEFTSNKEKQFKADYYSKSAISQLIINSFKHF